MLISFFVICYTVLILPTQRRHRVLQTTVHSGWPPVVMIYHGTQIRINRFLTHSFCTYSTKKIGDQINFLWKHKYVQQYLCNSTIPTQQVDTTNIFASYTICVLPIITNLHGYDCCNCTFTYLYSFCEAGRKCILNQDFYYTDVTSGRWTPYVNFICNRFFLSTQLDSTAMIICVLW